MTRATGKFEIDSWDEDPYDELEGTKLARPGRQDLPRRR